MNRKPGPVNTPDSASGEDLWTGLRHFTAARIGLERTGASLATRPLLDFQLAHARARDAVHEPFDSARLAADVSRLGLPVLEVASAVDNRRLYLTRPDLGRRLSPDADAILAPHAGAYDVVLVVTDGLAARAVEMHAAPVLAPLVAMLRRDRRTIAPLVIVRHGRTAIGDAVSRALGAACVVVLVGERPGLSAPHSMGAYLTWRPNAQTTDADRNCISNIRPEGVIYDDAAFKIAHLLHAMHTLRYSGVRLKDGSDRLLLGGG